MNNLVRYLKKLIALLDQYGEQYWVKKLRAIEEKINGNQSSDDVISEMNEFFQGAGTLDDLVILKSNGHRINEKDEKKVNSELDELVKGIRKEVKIRKK